MRGGDGAVLRVVGGDEVAVFRGDEPLPAPPTRATLALLIGLCHSGETWSLRETLAAKLYPESTPSNRRVSLRQTLSRLRRWVGADRLEVTRTHLRLAPGFEFEPLAPPPPGGVSFPAPDHSWLARLPGDRPESSRPHEPSVEDAFANLVHRVARVDRDEARALLVGGVDLASRLSPDQLFDLLSEVRPRDRRDPEVFGYLMLLAEAHHRAMSWHRSLSSAARAERHAVHRKSRLGVVQAMAKRLFSLCEVGHMGEAAECAAVLQARLDGLAGDGESSNALACFHWNSGRLDLGLKIMDGMARFERGWPRSTRIHYWTNRAVLAGEARALELAADCTVELGQLYVEGQTRWLGASADIATARLLELQGEPLEAARRLDAKVRELEEGGWAIDRMYALEALAEMQARSGSVEFAAATWLRYGRMRSSSGSRPNPRYFLRRACVLLH
ncbi:MAG: hypothetical protein M9921_13160 [Fimbriimonadaceae bacterium]|nr:hypothetical protein [Fimbriimonadaceae bacterium]